MDTAESAVFDPSNVDLTSADPTEIICFLTLGQNEYNGSIGARISALFVILIVSTFVTFFPVLATRVKRFRIPLYVYLFARYFGAGVIVATAFIHLMDPAYSAIGPNTCVGSTGGWAEYSWPPAIMLVSVMLIFLVDFAAERYVEVKYGIVHTHTRVEDTITTVTPGQTNQDHDHSSEIRADKKNDDANDSGSNDCDSDDEISQIKLEKSFKQQIAAFLILEFGVIFHSVIIGLNLGTAGSEFSTLYPVLVFHQSFEGLGVGARLSVIPFPRRLNWLPWLLCSAYGLTTPIAIAIGLGLRTTYNSGSFTANVVSGVLDSFSAGILLYTGLVELLARDFIFDPKRTQNNKKLTFMITCVLLGAGVMALLGKWA